MEKRYFTRRVYYKANKLGEQIPDADARITQDVDEFCTNQNFYFFVFYDFFLTKFYFFFSFSSGFETFGLANLISNVLGNVSMGVLSIGMSAGKKDFSFL